MKRVLTAAILGLPIASAWAHPPGGQEEGVPWPRFRGPDGSGISVAGSPPLRFGPEENVLWKTPVPPGHSSPVLDGRRVFLTAYDDESLITLCLDSRSGKVLWKRALIRSRRDPHDPHNNPASPTPVTDGEYVYVFLQEVGLIAYGAGGRERWRLPLGPFNNAYGMAASPVLAGRTLVLLCDQDTDSFILAVDADSGRVLWRRARPEARSGHSTPVVYRGPAGEELILAAGSFQLAAYSLATGEKRWWVNGLPFQIHPLPVLGKGMVFVNGRPASGLPKASPPPFRQALATLDRNRDGSLSFEEAKQFEGVRYLPGMDLDHNRDISEEEWDFFRAVTAAHGGLMAIRLGPGRGDRSPDNPIWRYEGSVPDVASLLLYNDVLFMINEGGVLTSFEPATGSVLKKARLSGAIAPYYASPVAADGKIYLANLSGDVAVVEASADWKLLAVNRFEEPVYATPALDREHIYIRTAGHLYCLGRGRSGSVPRSE